MKFDLLDILRLILPSNKTQKDNLANIRQFFDLENYNLINKLIKTRKIKVSYSSLGTSPDFLTFNNYPSLVAISEDNEVIDFIKNANDEIAKKTRKESYKKFSINADEKIISLIAPNIIGMDTIKLACALQLFDTDKTHILLLGDPGTGKTDIIRSVSELHPKTSFGLGSGTSGAGLGVMFKGNEMIKGLLPLANNGLCCIDELNLMKPEDRASLYNAMEKGFITYDKANNHVKVDANVSILATANPKGDRFVGWMTETLKKQLPFDSALLTRFHLMFLIRKPDTKEFLEIAKHILKGKDKKEYEENKIFVKSYVEYARELDVELPKPFEKIIIQFVEDLKRKEDYYLIEISPRLVVGIMRFCKASARMNLRKQVTSIDLERVKKIFLESLEISNV